MTRFPADDQVNLNVISLSEARIKLGRCWHNRIVVDEENAEVECQDCGEKLNPVHVLARLARAESRLEYLRKEVDERQKALEEKSKVKCQHCGRFTHVRSR